MAFKLKKKNGKFLLVKKESEKDEKNEKQEKPQDSDDKAMMAMEMRLAKEKKK